MKKTQSFLSTPDEANFIASCIFSVKGQMVDLIISEEVYSISPSQGGYLKIPNGINQVRFVVTKAMSAKWYDRTVVIEENGKKVVASVSVGKGVTRIEIN